MNLPDTVPHDVAVALRQAAPRIQVLIKDIRWYDCVGSTNDVAVRFAERGAPEGTVVAADAQTAGRGRMGRGWVSPPEAGLYASVLLRPAAAAIPLLTLAAGVAIGEGIEAATGLSPELKWPNDVYAGGRKLAGILAEGGVAVVLGFGINLRPAAYPPEIASLATSLEGELGRDVDRGLVLAECLAALAVEYGRLCAGDHHAVLSAWRSRASGLMGRPVELNGDRAVAEGIDDTGALLVRTATGIRRVISGEVRWM